MSDYTAAEVETAVEAAIEADVLEWRELEDKGAENTIILRGESIKVETVADDRGGEGHGEDIWFVIRVGDQLFEKTGYYMSHEGSDWDGDFTEVHPVEKLVTVYEAKAA